ncbi:MAG: hypothetical protein IKP19_10475 [Oscillospiraceae bacterium]|nr:hypothetical protein [Oscillospiraceae bacterium]
MGKINNVNNSTLVEFQQEYDSIIDRVLECPEKYFIKDMVFPSRRVSTAKDSFPKDIIKFEEIRERLLHIFENGKTGGLAETEIRIAADCLNELNCICCEWEKMKGEKMS